MFNKLGETKMAAKGFALVAGDKVEVLVGASLLEAIKRAQLANRYAPLERARVAHCTFEYAGMGRVEYVKLGRFV